MTHSLETHRNLKKQVTPTRRAFLAAICILAAAPNAKIGDVQLVEILLLLHFAFLAIEFALAGFRCRVYAPWRSLGIPHLIFLALVFVLALASLRFRFYPPPDIGFLKQPLVLSVARVTEISLGAFYMVYLAATLGREPENRMFAIRAYFWTGIGSAIYSLLSYPVLFATHLELGVYLPDYRARGGFNEGGPYGLYIISVMLVGLLLYQLRGLKRYQIWGFGGVLLLTLFSSQSKAAFVAGCVVCALSLLLIGTVTQKITLAALVSTVAFAIWTMTPVADSAMGYFRAYEAIQIYGPQLNQQAYGGFGGRTAGLVLVPRMIEAHPITGIGLGNFSLLRNSPDYLQGLPASDTWELPGIGLVAYVAELGVPLFLYLMALLFKPAWLIRHSAPVLAFLLALYQPVAHIFGAQLNFYYPWICTALALSVSRNSSTASLPAGRNHR